MGRDIEHTPHKYLSNTSGGMQAAASRLPDPNWKASLISYFYSPGGMLCVSASIGWRRTQNSCHAKSVAWTNHVISPGIYVSSGFTVSLYGPLVTNSLFSQTCLITISSMCCLSRHFLLAWRGGRRSTHLYEGTWRTRTADFFQYRLCLLHYLHSLVNPNNTT